MGIQSKSKNLLDTAGATIQKQIDFIQKNNETVIGISLNENTKNKLEKEGIFGFKNLVSGNIPIIINNNLLDDVVEIHREKNSIATPYEEYKGE